jgi:hypothetical protein
MPSFSPKTLTIVEANPETVSQFDIFIRDTAETPLSQTSVPSDPSGTTVVPIGSNGLFDAITVGSQINIYVGEVAAPNHGQNIPPVLVSGGPYTVVRLADGAESITVTI